MRKLLVLLTTLTLPSALHAQPISQLPPASTPLSGQELVPLVQGGVTKRAAVGLFAAPALANSFIIGSATPLVQCDRTGAVDATSCLNTMITAAEAVNGALVVAPGTYKVTGSVLHSAPATIYAYGVTLKWGASAPGSCCTPIVKIGNTSTPTYTSTFGMNVFGLRVDGNFTNNLYGFEWDTVRQSHYEDLQSDNISGSVIGAAGPFAYYCNSTGTHGFNTSANIFVNLQANGDWQGMALTGDLAVPAYCTVNTFINTNLFNTTAFGLDIVQNADTNYFYGTNLGTYITSGTWVGIRFNDGPNPTTQNNGATEEYFSGLTMTGGGGSSINYGLDINYANDIVVDAYRESSAGGTYNSIVVGGPASAVSYTVNNLTDPQVTRSAAPPPVATPGATAGSGAPTPVVVASSTSLGGTITFGTGTGASAGVLVNVAFSPPLQTNPKSISITPTNGVTAALTLLPGGFNLNGFTVFSVNAPASSQPNTHFTFNYSIVP